MKSTKVSHAPTLEILALTLTEFGRLGNQISKVLCGKDHRKAVAVTINPKGYSDYRDFMLDYAALNLVKKYPYLQLPGVNPRIVAMEKFLKSEISCRRVNIMFTKPSSIPHDAMTLLIKARRIIRGVLGPFCLDDIVPFLSHGPGATFGSRKDRGHPWYKFGDIQPTVTGECLALHNIFIKYCELWGNIHSTNAINPLVVTGSKVTTVPKDAKCDRIIAIEPLLNMFYQKGIGGLMRKRLRMHGCDLNDQVINQSLALRGSLDNSLATIDLSSASDSVARGLVEFLLPADWLQFMNATRSNYTTAFGEKIFLQKYSSMGNGFTFELESLIFLALCRAVRETVEPRGHRPPLGSNVQALNSAIEDLNWNFFPFNPNGKTRSRMDSVVSVYGDDIIVDSHMAPKVIALLETCGFATNVDKTFIDGPFRESCGKHYFLGHDVTPLYVKADIHTQDRYLWYLNSIRRFAHRLLGVGYGCDARLQRLYGVLYSLLDPKYRSLSIPEGFGDGGVVRDFDECAPKPMAEKSWVEGYICRHRVRVITGFIPYGDPQLLVSIFRLLRQNQGLEVESTSSVRSKDDVSILRPIEAIPLLIPKKKYRWKVSQLSVPRWPELGPWVSSF